jgi:hypothetical protein
VEAELELGDHAKVATTATQTPEQVYVLRFARTQYPAVGGHDFIAGDVVTGKPALPGKPTHAATEGQTADAGVGDIAGRGGQAERLRGSIEGAEQRAAPHPGTTPVGVDPNGGHEGEIEHQSAFRHRESERAVTAAAHPYLETLTATEAHRGGDIGRPRAASNNRRPPIDHRVPDLPRLVIGIVIR